jgi:hypothetical protein
MRLDVSDHIIIGKRISLIAYRIRLSRNSLERPTALMSWRRCVRRRTPCKVARWFGTNVAVLCAGDSTLLDDNFVVVSLEYSSKQYVEL